MAKNLPPAETEAKAPPSAKPAPAMKSGDVIELNPLLNKVVALRVTSRSAVQTKFGQRELSEVIVLVQGETVPLDGVLFQSYFQHLDIGDWYIGRIVKGERAWGMDATNLDPKVIAALNRVIATMPDDSDVPF